MCPAPAPSPDTRWLLENGPKELEQLVRSIVYYPSIPIIIVDSEDSSIEASVGAAKLLGRPRAELSGRKIGEFGIPAIKAQISQQVKTVLEAGDGTRREVEITARAEVLPRRHVLTLTEPGRIQPSVQDYGLSLLDVEGRITAWYAGSERISGYPAIEALGQPISFLYSGQEMSDKLADKLSRAATEGHMGSEGWRTRKDGSRFWANIIVMALRDETGQLRGFARVMRDFSDRHDTDLALAVKRGVVPALSVATIAGVVSGEFDHVPEINDAFLDVVGYSRTDVADGLLNWNELTPPEYAPVDELAHEEALRFGACTPYEKQLIRKDGTRATVMMATAVLKLSPFRWISFIQDLSERNLLETVEEKQDSPASGFGEIVGNSAGLRRVQRQVELVAPTDATVLILGETGTGKELVARAVHRLSPRRSLPFITLNCAAIPTGLLESELFGYERGAFTGALQQKIGRFEMAHRGTLFLDEVGDIPIDLQPKLLRALQEKAFERLGGTKTIPIDVRLVAATNRNLLQMMGDKLFRSDLYYRLKVFPVTTPPLRDRPDDIPILVRHFTRKYSDKMGRQIENIPAATMQALVKWRWPGNIRELENFIERAVILSGGTSLRAPLDEIQEAGPEAAGSDTLEHVEREHILKVLRESGGVVTLAATRLGLHRTTLNAMLRKLGITRKDF